MARKTGQEPWPGRSNRALLAVAVTLDDIF